MWEDLLTPTVYDGKGMCAGDAGYVTIRLPSGEQRLILDRCMATVGTLSNAQHKNRKIGRAGSMRWVGRKPTVRGVAMNPVDHPHGGGRCAFLTPCSRGLSPHPAPGARPQAVPVAHFCSRTQMQWDIKDLLVSWGSRHSQYKCVVNLFVAREMWAYFCRHVSNTTFTE